jgi:beta-lactamase regulating signal transducer with metallopeptidase domain
MMLAWMGYSMLAAAALGVTAWLIDFAVAGRLGRRRVLWAVVFLASAIGPVVLSATRGIRTTVVAENDGAVMKASGRKAPIVSDRVLGSAWLAVSAVVALGLVATERRLRRRLRDCPSRIVDGERVLVSADFGPAVVGLVRPQIVLPEWALATRESDQRIIVAHETEHRQARDPLLAAVALIVVAALPWNAALWWQLRRLRLAIEIDCDRRVVSAHGHDPHAYGILLLATRDRASRITPVLAMAMAAMRSALGRRVEALVGARPRSAARRLSAVAAAVVLATGMLSVPAPRLFMVRAAVVDAWAAEPPLARSTTSAAASPSAISNTPASAPPVLRQASTPSNASGGRPRRSAAVSPSAGAAGSVSGPTIRVIGSSVRAILPPPALTLSQPDSSARHRRLMEGTEERRGGRGGAVATVESRWITSGAATNRRILRSNPAGNRWILLPPQDSLRPSPP